MHDPDERKLIEKLQKIEALFARAASDGERAAAAGARERIRTRLEQTARTEPPVEYRFTLADGWSKALFLALLRRYGVRPYRYRGQRRTTVMAQVARRFVDDVLWPEFSELNATLRAHLDTVTRRIVAQAIHGDTADAEERERPTQLSLAGSAADEEE